MKGSDLLWIGVRCVTLPELLCQVCVTKPPTFADGDDSNLPLCFSIHNWKSQLYIQPSPSRNYTYTTVHYIIHQSLGSIVAANSWLSATIIQSAPSTGLCVSSLAVHIYMRVWSHPILVYHLAHIFWIYVVNHLPSISIYVGVWYITLYIYSEYKSWARIPPHPHHHIPHRKHNRYRQGHTDRYADQKRGRHGICTNQPMSILTTYWSSSRH